MPKPPRKPRPKTHRQKLQQVNHPKRGSSIKVEPIRDMADIRAIKSLLAHEPRNLCLFVFGINTAFRANELLSIRIGQIRHLQAGDTLSLKQSKNHQYRRVTLNLAVIEATRRWLAHHPNPDDHAPLFLSQRTGSALRVPALNRLVKRWCANAGLSGNYGSHTLRKTWGYQHRVQLDTPIPLLMQTYGHATQQQTLEYLGIQDKEIEQVYLELNL